MERKIPSLEKILLDLKVPEVLRGFALEPLEEALSRYPLAGSIKLVIQGEEKGPPLLQVVWMKRNFTAMFQEDFPHRAKPIPVLPEDKREARWEALSMVVSLNEGCWFARALRRIQALAKRAIFLEGVHPPLELKDQTLRRSLKAYLMANLYLVRTHHLPLHTWEGGSWIPTPSWRIGEGLRVPVLQIAPWTKSGLALFLTPLGLAHGERRFSPREVLAKQGLDPLWAERVERGEEGAVKRLKEFAAMSHLVKLAE